MGKAGDPVRISGGIDMTPHSLAVERLTKVFDTPQGTVTAVDDVSFILSQGEFFTMLGPSGCGKTTTLRMIAGLERVTSGRIIFDDKDFTRFSAAQRNIGMVFQSYALFPHMKVFENVAYGLRIRKLPDGQIKQRVGDVLELTGLEKLGDRYPPDLSGGQQQRVSIARPWCTSRPCCCWMNRWPTSMPKCGWRCARRSGAFKKISGS